MKRVLAIWLPNWPVQRLVLAQPELAGRAVVLYGPSRRGQCVTACSAAARRAGVEEGIPVAEAIALLGRGRFTTESTEDAEGRERGIFELHDPVADRAALVELAQWCHRFGPTVGLEEDEAPETLLVDATNLAPLYGGEAALVEQVARGMRRRGLEARLALADTVGAAWGLARYGDKPFCRPEVGREIQTSPAATRRSSIARGASPWTGSVEETVSPKGAPVSPAAPLGLGDDEATSARGLCPWLLTDGPLGLREHGKHGFQKPRLMNLPRSASFLPLGALRLPAEMAATLGELGLELVGDVLALDREQLRSRFGPGLLARINQFTGATPEVFVGIDPPEEFVVEQEFEYPLREGEAIRYSVERLVERLAWLLAARRAGALAVACRVTCEGAAPAGFEFGLFQPTARPRHLWEIAELQLERLRLAGPAAAIELRVLRHAPLVERQSALFEEERTLGQSRELAGLVDRLAGRLGAAAVVRCRLVSDAQPELAYREESLVGSAWNGSGRAKSGAKVTALARRGRTRAARSEAANGDQRDRVGGALDRPLCLLAQPAAIETMSVVPDGPPIWFRRGGQRHEIVRHWGPERIETGWWRRTRAARDYYRVETREGRRFWLFRRHGDGRWFLQGNF